MVFFTSRAVWKCHIEGINNFKPSTKAGALSSIRLARLFDYTLKVLCHYVHWTLVLSQGFEPDFLLTLAYSANTTLL